MTAGTSQKVNQFADYDVRVRRNSANERIQAMYLDVGSGSAESPVTSANPLPVNIMSGLVPTAYDYMSLGYTGSNLTSVVYKTGGSGGTTVATLTLGYSGSTLTSVTKS